MSVLIGFTVAISSSCASRQGFPHLYKTRTNSKTLVANDFATAYHFTPYQSGLCYFGSLIGGILAIPLGGPVGEAVANYFTIRNNGVREPEFRLPAIAISVFIAPLGLVLYGLALERRLSFMVPVVGLGLCEFTSTEDGGKRGNADVVK